MYCVALRRADLVVVAGTTVSLTAEPVEGTALTLQRVDDVHGRHGLALGVLRVGDGISDDVLEEDLEHTASLFVDETGDTLHTSTSCQTANGRLRNALDVVSQHLPVAFGASLSESFAALSSARHFPLCLFSSTEMKRNQPDRFYRPTGAVGVGEPIEARGRVRRPGVFAGEPYSERGRVRRPCVSAVRIQSRVFATWPAHSLFLLFSLAIRDVCISQFYSMISQLYTDHVMT